VGCATESAFPVVPSASTRFVTSGKNNSSMWRLRCRARYSVASIRGARMHERLMSGSHHCRTRAARKQRLPGGAKLSSCDEQARNSNLGREREKRKMGQHAQKRGGGNEPKTRLLARLTLFSFFSFLFSFPFYF
jgi:hypothetical protein